MSGLGDVSQCSPCTPVIERIAEVRKGLHNFHKEVAWTIINFFLALLLSSELYYGSLILTLNIVYPRLRLWYIAFSFTCFFALCAIYHFCQFFNKRVVPMEITAAHQKLCGINNEEPGFKITPKTVRHRNIIDPVPRYSPSNYTNRPSYSTASTAVDKPVCVGPAKQQSPLNQSMHSPYTTPVQTSFSSSNKFDSFYRSPNADLSLSPNFSNQTAGYVSLSNSHSPGSYRIGSQNASWSPSILPAGSFTPPGVLPYSRLPVDLDSSDVNCLRLERNVLKKSPVPSRSPLNRQGFIGNPDALDSFLKEQMDQDIRQRKIAGANEPLSAAKQSMWAFGQSANDFLRQTVQKYQYQMARPSPQSTQSVESARDELSNLNSDSDVWLWLDVSQSDVDLWSEKLKKYLGQTILSRLMNEINEVNKILVAVGSVDVQVGEVSLSTLKQLAVTKSQVVPQLPALIPFLEVTNNQEYLVQRIRELSFGGCLSAFKWNAGGEFLNKKWEENQPTDSALLMHFLCCYMDARLPPHPKYPDGKTFTSQHFLRTPETPNLTGNKENLFIYETSVNPPHYKVVIEGNVLNLKRGRANFLEAILLFLYHVKTKEHGMLRRVSLGMSGINILWVLDS